MDIVFIIDNSSSMHKEHKSLGKQIERFLKGIKDLPYRIAVITTDISSAWKNPVQGQPYQDGKFISIGGSQFLANTHVGQDPSDKDIDNLVTAIVRPETIACDGESDDEANDENDDFDSVTGTRIDKSAREISDNCPTVDERGIYAANLAIEKQTNFFDKEAHLMFILLSDEDERSSEEFMETNGLVLEPKDLPETLVETVYNYLGAMQTFSFHSIIIPPEEDDDEGCWDKQNKNAYKGAGSGRGYYGEEYARLSKAKEPELRKYGNLIKGSIISICDRKFDRQLARIQIFAEIPKVTITCDDPRRIVLKVDGERVRRADLKKPEVNGRSLVFTDGYLPIGSKLQVRVYCSATQ